MGRKEKKLKSNGSPLHTLFVAWVLVVALAFAPAGTYYYQSGNLVFLMSFTGALFIIGVSLFVALLLGRMGSSSKNRTEMGDEIANLNKRGAIFGKR